MIQICKLNTAFGIVEISTNIVESNPPSELLTSAAFGNLFTRCQRVVRKPIRYVTIHFQDRSGAASLRCKNRAELSDPFVNRSPIRYGCCASAQAIRHSVDIASVKNSGHTPYWALFLANDTYFILKHISCNIYKKAKLCFWFLHMWYLSHMRFFVFFFCLFLLSFFFLNKLIIGSFSNENART